MREGEEEGGGREGGMRYRSAAFALKSAHALAGVGSAHFPALGVDADALLSPAAVLYLLRFAGDIITAEQTFVTGVVPPVRVVATVVLVAFVDKNFVSLETKRVGAKLCAGSVVGRDGTHLGLCIALKR